MREFVDGWNVVQLLGEGAFAKVKLLLSRATGEACAVKEVRLGLSQRAKYGDDVGDASASEFEESLRKEVHIHKLARHPNIVQCYGSRIDGLDSRRRLYIFLEYCDGGELFDRIEPECGMDEGVCQKYFLQLLDAVAYLHSRGIAHRDIKPENILFRETHHLKLTDFGMATLFRHNGQERLLERRCGTMPYIAPEVLLKSRYRASPADVWSCGMVLLAMLTGELPWGQPVPGEVNFDAWRKRNFASRPIWRRLSTVALATLAKVLNVSSSRRSTIDQIRATLWCKKAFTDADGSLLDLSSLDHLPPPPPPCKSRHVETADSHFSATQPLSAASAANAPTAAAATSSPFLNRQPLTDVKPLSSPLAASGDQFVSLVDFPAYSQPASDSFLVGNTQGSSNSCRTQEQQSQTGGDASSAALHRLVRRMTRFWIDERVLNAARADVRVRAILRQLGYTVTSTTKGIYTVTARDCRGAELAIKLTFIKVDARLLVDFRLARGCGLEFKKRFKTILARCASMVDKTPVMWWSTMVPVNANALPGIHDDEDDAADNDTTDVTVDKENNGSDETDAAAASTTTTTKTTTSSSNKRRAAAISA